MSIAYLDPGNIESDLQAGSVAQYKVRAYIHHAFLIWSADLDESCLSWWWGGVHGRKVDIIFMAAVKAGGGW